MSDLDRALNDAEREIEVWLTVRDFGRKYSIDPKYVYEAIRQDRLNFEVVRLTTGKRSRSIRIGPPKKAA
jgi:hypothetical protein